MVAAARQVLYAESMRKRDDLMLKHMRQQIRGETRNQKAAATEVGMLLRKRAQEQRDADAKRRREALEEQRLAAKNAAETKLLQARAEQAAAEARLASMRQIIINRRDAE